jgi:Cu(I)/Ag(I) efflux system membrane fusion protein
MRTTSAIRWLAICSLFLCFSGRGPVVAAADDAPAAVQYHCPMHPSFVQDHKGDCPICGMKLVPVKPAAKAPAAERAPAEPAAAAPSPAAMKIGAEKQKALGIVVAPAQRSSGARALRLLGRVVPDEARLHKVNAGVMGSMRDVSAATTGSRVKKGDVLGSFYAPDAVSAMQLYILNTQGYTRAKVRSVTEQPGGEKGEDDADVGHNDSSIYNANVQQRIITLENLGVSAEQRKEIRRDARVPDTIKILSPADGFVLARNVFPGLKFDRGFELYRIADLRKVWVLADVFPQDARHVRPGMRAEVAAPEQGVTLPATVREILPQFDAVTRTLKVKLELDNPGCVLRPDMFVEVRLAVDLPSAVVVPSDAVVNSGLVKRVFVQSGEGLFEPRRVETGWRAGDRVEIVKGLSAGEIVVTSGTFFLDSETRMRSPLSGAAAANPPVPSGSRSGGGAGAHMEGAHARAGDAR